MRVSYCFAGRKFNSPVAYEHPFDALMAGTGGLYGFLYVVVTLENNEQAVKAPIDVTELLFDFARWCALQVIDLWDAPAVVREYLETGKPDIDGRTIANMDLSSASPEEGAASSAALRAIVTLTPHAAAGWTAAIAQCAAPIERDAQRMKFKQMIDAELSEAAPV